MKRPVLTALFLLPLMVAAMAAPSATASPATTGAGPWGPPTMLYQGKVSPGVAQATSSRGMTVTVFHTNPKTGKPQYLAAVRRGSTGWSAPVPLSSGPVARPTVLAWGNGNVSVIWQTSAGQDDWLFHLRTVAPDGVWGKAEKLVTATYAYRDYQASINSAGEIALAWANGDLTDRVAVRHQDGTWTLPPAVPVVHPTFGGTPFIANPLKVFIDDSAQVTDVTWGTRGSSGRAIWMMRLADDDTWKAERVAPLSGGSLGYDWVPESHFAMDPKGDIAAVYPQQDPSSKQWSTFFAFRPATGPLGKPTLLSHLRCDYLDNSCADVAVADDGSALAAYGARTSDGDVLATVVRRSADGHFAAPHTISDPMWSPPYQGLRVASDGRGDAIVSFVGGTKQRLFAQFARCPATAACEQALRLTNAPSWLEPWLVTAGPLGGGAVTWVDGNHRFVASRQLAALTG